VVASAREEERGRVVVLLTFGDEAATVEVSDGVAPTDLPTNEDVGVDDGIQVESGRPPGPVRVNADCVGPSANVLPAD
jgi:hypothetical protein